MYILTNEDNEILSYAVIGGISGGSLVSDVLLLKLNDFRSGKYLYINDDVERNPNWVDPWDSEERTIDPNISSIKKLSDELENAKKTVKQQQAILNSLASTVIKQQLHTEDKEEK
ncbi:hypothetical protein [Brochothrix phage ADU4]|nr:hypothetical protein [Brochothrix phage ADU4]